MAKPSMGAPAPSRFFTPASDQSTVSHLKVTVQFVTPQKDGSLLLTVFSGNVAFGISIADLPGRPEYKLGDRLLLEYPKGQNPMTAPYSAIYHADKLPKVSPPTPTKKDSMSAITTTTVQTMSSREIAELTGKQHKDVLYDIRKMLESLGLSTADFSAVYKAENGQSYEQFVLPKRETLILVSGYSVEMRAKIIDRWQELEQKALQGGGAKAAPPSIIAPSREFRALFGVGRLLGLDKNAAAISANQAVNKITGVNLLSLLGQTSMEAGNQSEMLYTPTELGKRIGVSGIAFNKMLEAAGLQKRQGDTWERTQLAETFSKIQDTMKRHSDGTPVLQLKWYPSVIQMLNLEPKAA